MALTMTDIARVAGVSFKTVSRVMNNEENVKTETRDRVMRSVRDLGYVPNTQARALASGRIKSIGLIVNNSNHAYCSKVLQILLKLCREENYLLFTFSTSELKNLSSIIDPIRSNLIGGVVLAGNAQYEYGLISELIRVEMPYVLIEPDEEHIRNLDGEALIVQPDNRQGSRSITNYVIDQGHRRIGYIASEMRFLYARERLDGFKDALREGDISIDDALIVCNASTHRHGYDSAMQLMQALSPPTVIVCSADHLAIGAMNYLQQEGYRIPDDVSVVGFDDTPIAEQFCPSLTTVRQPLEEILKRALQLMIRRLDLKKLDCRTVTVATEVIVRESCKNINQ